jgi:hypothetical protein
MNAVISLATFPLGTSLRISQKRMAGIREFHLSKTGHPQTPPKRAVY